MVHKFLHIYTINQDALKEVVTPSQVACVSASWFSGHGGRRRTQPARQTCWAELPHTAPRHRVSPAVIFPPDILLLRKNNFIILSLGLE